MNFGISDIWVRNLVEIETGGPVFNVEPVGASEGDHNLVEVLVVSHDYVCVVLSIHNSGCVLQRDAHARVAARPVVNRLVAAVRHC